MSKRQDLTTYTETDIISDRLTVTSDKVTVSNLDTDETVIMHALTENEALDRPSEVPRE